jgi:endogenous inhibitor of DNA gyrase (YacG/DUF329 family)
MSRLPMEIRECEHCGKKMKRGPTEQRLKYEKRRFCARACKQAHIDRPGAFLAKRLAERGAA